MTEPTKEELMARIAELEKQAGGTKRSGTLEFRVEKRAESAFTAWGVSR